MTTVTPNYDLKPLSQAETEKLSVGSLSALLAAVAVSSTGATAEEKPADKTKEPIHLYASSGSIEMGGHMVARSGSRSMWDTLVNEQTGPRILSETLDVHTTNRKRTPFFDGLSVNSFGFGGEPYTSTTLRAYKGKIYKLDMDFHRNRQYFDYDLFANPLIPSDAVPYVPVLNSPHLFNTVRRSGDANLTILPISKISFRAGYWRTSASGPSFSSNVSKSLSNPLLNQAWRYCDETYTGGVDWKIVPKTALSYDQLVTHPKQDTTWNMAGFGYQLADGTPVNLGLNIFTDASNTCLIAGTSNTIVPSCNATLAYHRTEPVRTLFPTEQFRFVITSIPRIRMNGRVSYTGGSSEINHYSEGYSGWSDAGINTTGRNIIRYAGIGSNSHLGTLRRINVSSDFGITAYISSKSDVSDVVDFRSFRDPGVTQPHQETQFGTSLANTSNFFSVAICPPPYTAPTCPLHTKKTAADITQAYRQSYFGQTSTTNTVIAAYSSVEKLKVSIGYSYRDRSIIKTLQTTTTSTFTPPFANRGACATVALNSDGTCTVTLASTPAIENNEIRENWGLFAVATQPISQLSIKLNVDAMFADQAFTRISPRQLQHYVLRAMYKPNAWMSVAGAVNILESRDNVEFVHHLAHTRDFSLGTVSEPGDKWSLDVNYAYDSDYASTDVCYYSSNPLPGTGSCPIPGSVDNFQPYLGNGRYSDPSHFGSIGLMLVPAPKLRIHGGYSVSASEGNGESLDARQLQGSLQSDYHMPSGDVACEIAKHWFWKAGWNYYGYGEGSAVGPPMPRAFHGNIFTL